MAALILLSSLPAAAAIPPEPMSLAGEWRFELDPKDEGVGAHWEQRPLRETVTLPGSLPQQDKGDEITVETKWTGGIFDRSYFTAPEYAAYRQPGNIKVPFWLQPTRHFVGAAWYQRSFEQPDAWSGKRVTLRLERPHWKTAVWLDGRQIGTNDSLSVDHVYDFGAGLKSGTHRLTIRVDNTVQPDIGENSHSVSDHTQGNWNGIVGRIELSASAPEWIDDLQAYGRVADRVVGVRGRIGRGTGPLPTRVHVSVNGGPASDAAVAADGSFVADLALAKGAALWDEFSPALHRVTASLENGESRTATFGLREVRADGRQLTVNGRPVFLRGTLDCAAYPRTGHPPMDLATWKTVMGAIKAHGLNHIRFHSWCPPEAAFAAADELGMYVQVEVASWPNWSTTLGDGKPVDAWTDVETGRILRAYGNHPSFIMLCAGNEPGGDHFSAWLAQWIARQKAADARRLYTAGAGWPELPENDYFVTPEPRIQHWGEGLQSRINALPPETVSDYGDYIRAREVPVISHEIGQWCVYPNFAEMPKYTGYLKPQNFEIFRQSLEAHGMGAQAREFVTASGKLQALCYKEEIEAALRTPQMGGFQLLGLSDFPGQGTALVGVLDAFWEEKGYVSPAEFRRFCNSTVPLVRLAKRVFTVEERFVAEVEMAHYGAAPLASAAVAWRLVTDDGRSAAHGEFPARDLPVGNHEIGRIDIALEGFTAPARYRLVVTAQAGDAPGARSENDWDVWVYPRAEQVAAAAPRGVMVSTALDAATQAQLDGGGAVLLTIPPKSVAPDPVRGPIALGFSSIFWNTAWTNGQAPHTLGVVCDPRHGALTGFPTDAWSNWQWWYPVSNAAPMLLDACPGALQPIVQVIDDWATNRRLALVFEARLGRGRLLVTSIDLTEAVLDPVRRQLRASLLAYAASPAFDPKVTLTTQQLQSLIAR